MSDKQPRLFNMKFYLVLFVVVAVALSIGAYQVNKISQTNDALYDILDVEVEKIISLIDNLKHRSACEMLERHRDELIGIDEGWFVNQRLIDANLKTLEAYENKIKQMCMNPELDYEDRVELFHKECADNDGEISNIFTCTLVCETCGDDGTNRILYSVYKFDDYTPYDQEIWDMLK